MNLSNSYSVDILYNVIDYLFRYVTIPLYAVGNLGNILSAVVFFQKSWRKNVCVFYLLICLLIDTFNINPATLGYIFINGFNINLHYSSVILCKIFNYVTVLLSALLPTILVMASIDRLLISSQNVQTRLYSSRRLAYFSISIGTIFWFIFFWHILIKYDLVMIAPSIFICLYDLNGFYRDFFSISLLVINVTFFLTMIILSALSFKNVHRIRAVPRQQRQNIRTMHKKDFQLLRCLFVKNIVYIICSMVLASNALYRVATKYYIQTPWKQAFDNFLFSFGIFIYQINFCANFFIYSTMSRAFRQHFKRLVYKLFGKNLAPVREEEEQNVQDAKRDNVELNVVSTIVVPS